MEEHNIPTRFLQELPQKYSALALIRSLSDVEKAFLFSDLAALTLKPPNRKIKKMPFNVKRGFGLPLHIPLEVSQQSLDLLRCYTSRFPLKHKGKQFLCWLVVWLVLGLTAL